MIGTWSRVAGGFRAMVSLPVLGGVMGCGGASGPTAVTITGPAGMNVGPGESATFTARVASDSNSAGVTWTLSGNGCSGAGCGALSASSTMGVTYTAPATVTTGFTVTITATSVAKTSVTGTVTISVPVNPSITTAAGALGGGSVGAAYFAALTEVGGISPYTWTVTTGTLPAGLSLNASSGAITGTPTAAGSPSFTVMVKDSGLPALTAAATFSIAIAPAPAITFGAATLSGGTVGTAYSGGVTATGGAGTLTYALNSGALPAGLSLSSSGGIAGTPTKAGTSTFTVKAMDAFGDAGTSGSLSIAVVYPALKISPATLANGTVGTAYSATLSASGASGSGYSFAVTSGTGLSAVGLTLSASGVVSGTPTASETAGTFAVKLTDRAGNTVSATITLTVGYPALMVTTANLPSGTAGVGYSQTLTASGGSGQGYTWTVTSGTLSTVGLSLSSAGVLSGSTPVAGNVSFTVKVTDSASNTATANLSVTIDAALTVTTSTLPNGTVGTGYSATLGASGGTGTGYTWTVTSGTGLSAVGLALSADGAISGTPTAQEAATQFVVQVKDSGGNTATATLALIVNYATLAISTSGIPGATINVAYSTQLNATGGSGKYAWSVMTNASGLTGESLTLSTGGLLSGTPTSAANVSFSVQLKDTTTNNTATTSYTLVVSSATAALCSHDGSGNALLTGHYAFLLGGFDGSGNHFAQIGDFVADGGGDITGGNSDVNSSGFATQGEQQSTFSGTYSIGSTDHRGIMTLSNSNASATTLPATSDYCFVAHTVTAINGSNVAESGQIMEADGSGFVMSGFFQIQNQNYFTNGSLNGGYVLGVEGVNAGSGGTPRAAVDGQIVLNGAGIISSGQFDIAQYDMTTGSTTLQTAQTLQSGSGGTYSIASTGRGTLSLATSGGGTPFVVYVVGNGNELLMLSADNINTNTLLSGRAIQQTQASFTTANVKATSVFRATGVQYSGSPIVPVDDDEVGQFVFDGAGNISALIDQNHGGTISPIQTGAGTYTVSSIGYVVVTTTGNHSPKFYLASTGEGFGMDGGGSVTLFTFIPQTVPSGGFTTSSLSGDYGLGAIPPEAYSINGSGNAYPSVQVGILVATSSTLSLTSDQDSAPGLPTDISVDQTGSNPWALDSTYGATAGRFLVTTAGGSVVGYLASPTQVFLLNETTGKDPEEYEADHQ